MRISFIIHKWLDDDDGSLVGGSAKSPFRLVKYLSRLHERPYVIYFNGPRSRQEGVILCRVEWAKLFVKTILQNLIAVPYVYKAFRDSDIVQCHHPHYGLTAALLKMLRFREKIFIVKAHGTAVPELKANRYRGVKGWVLGLNAVVHRSLDSFVLSQADAVLCSSQYQESEMATLYGVDPARLRTVYNGFDPEYFQPRTGRNGDSRKDLRIGFCGRVVAKKNIMYSLDVCEALVKAGQIVSLELVLGDKDAIEDKTVYSALQRRLKAVSFPVQIYHSLAESDYARVLSSCDVGLVPSVGYESIPSVVYEFAATGALVFASYQWGIPEILRPEYALSGDAETDAGRILAALKNPDKSSLIKPIEGYSYQSLTRHYTQLYESLSR